MRRRSECFTFPHYKTAYRAVQPDYTQWKSVAIGMTRDDVIDLLGPPLRDPYSAPRPRKTDLYYVYGYLQMPMTPHVRTYRIIVGFDDEGRVSTKIDPFGGVFSVDSKPSKPLILTPPQGAVFSHYPRIVDMRWHPTSGKYPIWYEVEIGFSTRMPSESGTFHDEIQESELQFPYFVIAFVGDSPGRFRVRGINALGNGEWSDYRYFDFTPRPPAQI